MIIKNKNIKIQTTEEERNVKKLDDRNFKKNKKVKKKF